MITQQAIKSRNTQLIKQKAQELGFLYCGISAAGFLEQEAPKLAEWLQKNMHGEMAYMANHFDKRLDPRLLVEGAKSVITVLLNYFPKQDLAATTTLHVSKYAYGEDYHTVVKQKLKGLMEAIHEEIGQVSGRAFVDSAPVMDKAWAQKSGAGWIGKHSNLINRKAGSFFFIGELILDLPLVYDSPVGDYCGTCTRCIDACPTEAIVAPYVVDGSRCISYFTIELKNEIPNEVKGKFQDWVFGCDICQDVCPWNRFSTPHQVPAFEPIAELQQWSKQDWEEVTEEVFNRVFRKSALKRAKLKGLQRNIRFVATP
ncbi:MAG TPA: tRNA epoxyqueuosine(34) reductase QueG [Microscillaceae bacterium]|jgi:epoxyqueuosine reductase|nr:tRNA epoxyqueuosine(34) reductase QueG [Microscillaceae bacterium]